MKYLLFVTIDELGHSKILAACLIKNEDAVTFEWCFTKFQESFGGENYRASVIFSDGDQAMITAAESLAIVGGIWEGIVILRCVFHLWKKIFNYLAPYYMTNKVAKKKWNLISGRFWRFIHETDIQLQPLFDEAWEVFSAGIKEDVRDINEAQIISLQRKNDAASHKRLKKLTAIKSTSPSANEEISSTSSASSGTGISPSLQEEEVLSAESSQAISSSTSVSSSQQEEEVISADSTQASSSSSSVSSSQQKDIVLATVSTQPGTAKDDIAVALKALKNKYTNLVIWIDSMGANKRAWAGTFTASIYTGGASSTSRVESENAVIKGPLKANKKSTCTQLTKRVVEYAESVSQRQAMDEEKRRKYTQTQNDAAKDSLGKKVSSSKLQLKLILFQVKLQKFQVKLNWFHLRLKFHLKPKNLQTNC